MKDSLPQKVSARSGGLECALMAATLWGHTDVVGELIPAVLHLEHSDTPTCVGTPSSSVIDFKPR